MGTSGQRGEAGVPEMYLALGLAESGDEVSGIPRVVSLLASVLERSIQKKEKFPHTSNRKDAITVFHGSRSPSLSIRQYVERIFKYSRCSNSCYVVAFIYIDRFLHRTNAYLTPLNVHRLLITSIMLAAKFLDDECYNNAYYAKVGGVSTAEMNRMEMKLLYNLDFRLHVTVDVFQSYCLKLEKECPREYKIDQPIQVCGLKGGSRKADDKRRATRMKEHNFRAI